MAAYHPNLGFDTLEFAQALIAKGYEQKQAEALAVIVRDYVISGLATNGFVAAENEKIRSEIKEAVLNLKTWIGGVAVVMTGRISNHYAATRLALARQTYPQNHL